MNTGLPIHPLGLGRETGLSVFIPGLWFGNQLPQNYLDYPCLINFVNWIFCGLGIVRHDLDRQWLASFEPNIEPKDTGG